MKITVTLQGKEVNTSQIIYLKNINKVVLEDTYSNSTFGVRVLLDFIDESIPSKYFNTFLEYYYTIELDYKELEKFINII
jgi:hypothetical protein